MKKSLTIGIVDDCEETRVCIKERTSKIILQEDGAINFLLYSDGVNLLSSNVNHDIIILDYDMPVLNGLDTMVKLNKLNPKPLVIFLTGIPMPFNVVMDSVRLHPFDFLLKTHSDEKFEAVVRSAINQIKTKESITITYYQQRKDEPEVRIKSNIYILDIVNLFADGKSCYIITTSGTEYETRKAMSFWLDALPQDKFKQINKQSTVNLEYVDRANDQTVYLTNEEELPLSRKYRKEFKEALAKCLLSGGK